MYCKSSYCNPLLSPREGGGGLFFKPIWGGLIETELILEGEAYFIILETTMVSVLSKEL